jgi:F0F1-type ATP synthase assembly protein I
MLVGMFFTPVGMILGLLLGAIIGDMMEDAIQKTPLSLVLLLFLARLFRLALN